MPDLVLERVTKRFGELAAVDDLSFSVEHGEFVCLLGPSGCGKTTTLRMIAGFERPDAGRILIDGQDVTNVPPQRRDIGVVFQHYALFPHMTVAENVGFGLKMRNMPRAQANQTVDAALALVRLQHLPTRLPSQLSGGQQQRVALARALAIRPRLLLLDEPLSNLDAKLRDEMRDEIRRIQREVRITAIFVTHDQTEAFALADRVAVMDRGRLHQFADPVSIYETPADTTVGSFIGQASVFEGEVVSTGDGRVRVKLAGDVEIAAVGAVAQTGVPAKVFVKQERITMARARSANPENEFACRVVGRTYLGDSTSYALTADGLALKAIIPNRPEFERFAVGDQVFASWAAADSQVFPS
jgi:spermidine/putrescine ABC transporter ATP-binding subunit